MNEGTNQRRERNSQSGHLMAGLMVMIAIMLIFSTLAFQAWEDELARENEAEMMFRMWEYARAIQRYRQDHGGVGPLKLEDLLEPGPKQNYYLRRDYDDPLTRDGKWAKLYVGPNGQVIDPNGDPAAAGVPGTPGGGIGGLANSGAFGGNNNQGGPGNNSGGGLGNNNQGGLGNAGNNTNPADPFGGFQPSGAEGGPRELNGLPIAGVRTMSSDEPFRVFRDFTDYKDWLITYLDVEALERAGVPGDPSNAKAPGQPGTGQNQRGGRGGRGGRGARGARGGAAGSPGTTGTRR